MTVNCRVYTSGAFLILPGMGYATKIMYPSIGLSEPSLVARRELTTLVIREKWNHYNRAIYVIKV